MFKRTYKFRIFKQNKGYLWLSLGVGIYYDGFNEKVFKDAAATLKSATDKIRLFLKPKADDTSL